MAKIRPKTGPAAPPGTDKAGVAKKKDATDKPEPSASGQSQDHSKTAADLTKSKASRTGKLLESKPGAARAAAAKKKASAADLTMLMRRIVTRVVGIATRVFARVEARIERVHTIIQRHHELGYVVRFGSKGDDTRDEEIKRAALRLRELRAGSGEATPALRRLMERASGLDANSPASDWAAKFKDAGKLIDQAGQELHDVNTELALLMKNTEEELVKAEETQSAVLKRFEDDADAILNRV